jgi:L-seryl-tRNA(Ser) seleniumtransferase
MNAAGLKHQCVVMNDWTVIPSVEKLLQSDEARTLSSQFGRPLLLSEIRDELEILRVEISKGKKVPAINRILERVRERLESINTLSIKPVINATGVILHTNLGRAPISKSAAQAILNGVQGYSSLEYDLIQGERSHRSDHSEWLLQRLLGLNLLLS